MNPSSYRNCTKEANATCGNKMAQNTERSRSGDSHGKQRCWSEKPPDSVLSPQTSALSGSHWAPRERLASTTWQYLRPGWFLWHQAGCQASPSVCETAGQGARRARDKKHLLESPSCWLPEFTCRESQGSWLPGHFQDVPCPREGHCKLQDLSSEVSQHGSRCKAWAISIWATSRAGGRSTDPPDSVICKMPGWNHI